ncbi:MAG: potassium-transporting ATPase subunit KdpA, partial [Candidatus Sericytochromatia bacterium]
MTKSISEIFFLFFTVFLFVEPIGLYIYKVIQNEKTLLTPILSGVENFLYKIIGTNKDEEHNWKEYLFAVIAFSFFGMFLTFIIQLTQGSLPLNTQNLSGTSWHLALNTAVSFTTNTNWQSYVPEQTMSYFTQMIALATHNFMSAATG